MADLTAAALAHERAVTGGTHDSEFRSWKRWEKYCASVGCTDLFMDRLSRQERILMLGAFGMAVREGRFSGERHGVLAEGTVRGTISNVVQTFRATGRQNPTKDGDFELSILLSRQLRALKNEDPKQQQQKTLPFIVLDEVAKRSSTELEIALAQLSIGAAFFACRSCEYSKVPKGDERRTKLLCLRNVRLFRDRRLISTPFTDLESADSVAITFEMQKNDEKHNTVIHGRTDDPTLCPVLQWGRLVNRILSYPGTSQDTQVCTVWRHGRLDKITSKQVQLALRAACTAVGSARLGFELHEIGTHSLRSGAAMEIYLAGVPMYTIMLIGRWSSDASLHYIRKQVEQFSKHVVKQMLTFRSFWTVPDIATRVVSNEDPRQRNHRDNAETRRNIGRDASRRVQLPAFSLFN